jgi:Tfp pilus assembly protein FimV
MSTSAKAYPADEVEESIDTFRHDVLREAELTEADKDTLRFALDEAYREMVNRATFTDQDRRGLERLKTRFA